MLRSFELGQLSEENACSVLDAIESFLFRRAISGIEPTGLHAVFKSLWQDLVGDTPVESLNDVITSSTVRSVVSNKPTITWPNDEEFRFSIENAELYRRKIVGYALREYEISLKGETPSDGHQVEHIAPQTSTDIWKSKIPEDYEKLVHTWGNLLPLTPTMNPSTGQSDFSVKKVAYANSIFASTREVANLDNWDGNAIRQRSKTIASWALTRWPH